mmetsp:Transcript_7365/g.15585  ORF Transcript_7365/g.15585 Transcript_7365/m.15585 type:complete len:236 (+) Transcript_7365:1099-1806(+)
MSAAKRPRQERAEEDVGPNGIDGVELHVVLCGVESLAVLVRNTYCRVGLFTKEDAHDAIEGEVEEAGLQVHLLRLTLRSLQKTAQYFCLLHEDLVHQRVEILPTEDLRGNFAHVAPLLTPIFRTYAMLAHENAITQELLEVEEERIVQAFWLRVLVELILQDVTHDLRIVCDQCVHPRVPAKTHVLGNRLPIADFKTPVVNTVEVRCKVLEPASRCIVPGSLRGGHIFQKALHPR